MSAPPRLFRQFLIVDDDATEIAVRPTAGDTITIESGADAITLGREAARFLRLALDELIDAPGGQP